MFVVTTDQRRSQQSPDRIDPLRDALAGIRTVRPFDRTAGDEMQAVFDDAQAVVDAVLILLGDGHWSVGVGIGDVEVPLPHDTRAGRGPAFVAARDAVNAAKTSRHHLAAHTPAGPARLAQTALILTAQALAGRSPDGWAAVTAMRRWDTQREAAAALGISPQAMSQRLQVANYDLEDSAKELAAQQLSQADAEVLRR